MLVSCKLSLSGLLAKMAELPPITVALFMLRTRILEGRIVEIATWELQHKLGNVQELLLDVSLGVIFVRAQGAI